MAKFCMNCGKELREEDKFCGVCGEECVGSRDVVDVAPDNISDSVAGNVLDVKNDIDNKEHKSIKLWKVILLIPVGIFAFFFFIGMFSSDDTDRSSMVEESSASPIGASFDLSLKDYSEEYYDSFDSTSKEIGFAPQLERYTLVDSGEQEGKQVECYMVGNVDNERVQYTLRIYVDKVSGKIFELDHLISGDSSTLSDHQNRMNSICEILGIKAINIEKVRAIIDSNANGLTLVANNYILSVYKEDGNMAIQISAASEDIIKQVKENNGYDDEEKASMYDEILYELWK